jgi:phosphatidate cytidylyltransferase
MRTRVILGVAMLATVLGLVVLDHSLGIRAGISALVVVLGIAGWCELAHLAGIDSRARGGGVLLYSVGLLSTAYFLLLAWCEGAGGATGRRFPLWESSGIAGLVFFSFAAVVFRSEFERRYQPMLMTILGGILFGFLFSFLLRIYHHKEGSLRAFVFVVGIKGNDIAAYLFGRAMGTIHFLKVSPKKSLEGCLAALLFSVIWFTTACAIWPETFFPWPWGIPLGIILSITTQVGDLSESLIKRCYQVKDSSSLIPEFGGILDLVDSVLFSGYVFWLAGAAELSA